MDFIYLDNRMVYRQIIKILVNFIVVSLIALAIWIATITWLQDWRIVQPLQTTRDVQSIQQYSVWTICQTQYNGIGVHCALLHY